MASSLRMPSSPSSMPKMPASMSKYAQRLTKLRSGMRSFPTSRWPARLCKRTSSIQSSFTPTPRSTISPSWNNSSLGRMLPTSKQLETGVFRKVSTTLPSSCTSISTTTRSLLCVTFTSKNTEKLSQPPQRLTMFQRGSMCVSPVCEPKNSDWPPLAVSKSSSTPITWTKLSPTTLTWDTSPTLFLCSSKGSDLRMLISEFSPSWVFCTPSTFRKRSWNTARYSSPSSMSPRLFGPANVLDCGSRRCTSTLTTSNMIVLSRS
mmetsp:Transcript_126312/g.353719  ORF Transcript_126312/g.353719 Transcript_126312/m.353719 type:complete len:262 (+) Transcript_126312:3192-3977(+)